MAFDPKLLKQFVQNKPFQTINLNVNHKFEQKIIHYHDKKKTKNNYLESIFNKNNEISNTIDDDIKIKNIDSGYRNHPDENIKINYDTKIIKEFENILGKDKYKYQTECKDSYIESLLAIVDPQICIMTKLCKINMIKEFKNKIGLGIDENFKILNYKKNNKKKSNIQDILLNEKKILDDDTKKYILDILNIHALIINSNREYLTLNDYDDKKRLAILFQNKNNYYPILSQNNSFISIIEYNNIKKDFSHRSIFVKGMDLKKEDLSSVTVRKMKIKELQELALKMNISIYHSSEKKKKKLKNIF